VDYSLVKQELANAIKVAEIPDLDSYSYLPDSPHLPCFIAGEVDIEVNNSFGPGPGGFDIATVTCSVFVSDADDLDGQRKLDQLISRSGTYSVRQALWAARGEPGQAALNGACDDFSIDRISGYGLIQLGNNQSYYGANITVRLIGSGD
jgi:hypothetical protein